MDLSALGLDDEVKTYLKEQKDFVIDRVSQEGGNCDIFFGYHKIFDRRIALKVYYGNDISSSHNEPRILSKIDHPNILRIRDAKRIGNYFSYFMTDEIDGGDLEKFYQRGAHDLKECLNIIHGILNGLTELHRPEVSIVHRDLKPKNILIYNSNKQPLISDFGSVKHFDFVTGSTSGSKSTLIYTPKESFELNIHTTQSDIYQVGISMFQILGGFFPGAYIDWLTEKEKLKLSSISGAFDQDVFIRKVIHKLVSKDNLLRYQSLPPYIDASIIRVIKKATHPTLSLRYANTAAFMQEIYKILQSLSNWRRDGDVLTIVKRNGHELRISKTTKGYITEKKATNGWRKKGEHSIDIETQIRQVQQNN